MGKQIKIFKSFKEEEQAEIEYWQNLPGEKKLEVLDAIQFMHLKMLYPEGKQIEKSSKNKKVKKTFVSQTKNISHRSILINQKIISYKLRHSLKAKYIRLQIPRTTELEVILPRGCSIAEAEKFIIKKSNWINKHLQNKKRVTEEEKFLVFGNEIEILQTFDFFAKKHKINFKNGILNIVSPAESKTELRTIFNAWLKNYSKKYIPFRTKELAEKFNFSINKITIRGQKTRWGSCSSKGNLSFNFKLMQFEKEIIDYVIIHELCHLKEMNHSKKFWNLVEKYCPDYKNLRKELKVPII